MDDARKEPTNCRTRLHSALRYLTREQFERISRSRGSDGSDGSGGKPKDGLPPPLQALKIPTGFPHSRLGGLLMTKRQTFRNVPD
jgi:hypothetical protein